MFDRFIGRQKYSLASGMLARLYEGSLLGESLRLSNVVCDGSDLTDDGGFREL